ncbi:MAG: GtrA family protein [Euryarchaeota archaeon]|nr:GtrA family protein [Euryarchaeota archaeon]
MSEIDPAPEEVEAGESTVKKALHLFPPGILWKFVLVGLLGFFTQYFVLTYIDKTLDVDITRWPFWVSVEAGIIVTFILNDQWVFKTDYKNSIFIRFLSYEGTLFIGAIFQWLLFMVFYAHILFVGNRFWANAWAVFFATIWNYIIMRKFIFKGGEDEDSDNGSGSAGKHTGSDTVKE